MNRFGYAIVGSLAVLLSPASPASFAQSPFQPNVSASQSRPNFSPYLNLLRGGSTTLNYYGLVRPEVDLRRSIGQLDQQVGGVQQKLAVDEAATSLPATGRTVRFMSHTRYFLNQNGMGGAGGFNRGLGAGTGGAARPPTAMGAMGAMGGMGAMQGIRR